MSALAEIWLRLALLGLAGVLAERSIRRLNGAIRHALWVTVLAAAAALPLARIMFEQHTWTVSWWRAAEARGGSVMMLDLPLEAPPRSAAASTQSPARVPYGAILYGIIAAALLTRQLRSRQRLFRLRRSAQPVDPPEVSGIRSQLSCSAPVVFLTAPEVRVPFTAGWRAPFIFLPSEWAEWTPAKRRSVLAHEMAHVQRNDWLISRAAALVRTVFWAHPLFWWAERRLAALAEEAVDETAVALMGDPRAYAGAILDFALARTEQFEPMETTAMARTSKIGSRMERILSNRNYNIARVGGFALISMAAVALPVLYAAALVKPAPQPQEEPANRGGGGPVVKLVERRVPPPPEKPTTTQLQEAEAKVAGTPGDLAARVRLAVLYRAAQRFADAEKQVVYLIENQPSSQQSLEATFMLIGSDVRSAVTERLAGLWAKAAEKNASNAAVLQGAARILRLHGEYSRAEVLLTQTTTLEPANESARRDRAQLYAAALYASTGGLAGSNRPEPAFSEKARKLIESGTEMPLAGLVGELMIPPDSIVTTSHEAAAAARASNEKRVQIADTLLRRADELDPGNPQWKAAMERLQRVKAGGGVTLLQAPPPDSGSRRITVGGTVQAQMLKSKPEPEYPPLARQARIQGIVRFMVVIGSDGLVKHTTLISGHPLLVQPAINALRQYEYKPTTVGGEAVEVVTQVDVNFTLPPPAEVR